MQCSSYVPVYYHARSVNVGERGFSWHPFDSNANCGEERGYKTGMPPYNMDGCVGSDKEVLKQIIQNHEATFRNQVQELHRLYRRQKDLMDEMRVREIFGQHLSSQTPELIYSWTNARPEFSQTPPHSTSWILGDRSCNVERPSSFVAENSQNHTIVQPDSFMKRNSYNEIEFLLRKGSEKRIVDLELPASTCHDDQAKQFKEGIFSESPNFQREGDSDLGSVKTGDLSSFDIKSRKTNCFIDLNEPIDLESLSSSSSGHFETCHMEIKSCVPVEAIPESVAPKHSRLVNYDDSSDGINSSLAIDLNSVPTSCYSETVENVWSTCKDAETKNENCVVNTEIEIDLNTVMADENPPPLSSIRPAEDTDLEGPVSPENEECSPPRGESEDIQVDPPIELEIIAAKTLVMILSSGDEENTNPASLHRFAEIVSSIGDDLENQIMELNNGAADDNVLGENALNFPHVKKVKESGRSTGPLRRNAGKKACGKSRKCSKQSTSDVVKKSISSILKQPATRSKQGFLHSWGERRKRQGDRRRRLKVSEFVLVS